MTDGFPRPAPLSLRQRIAARAPSIVRKLVRMAEQYARRHAEWLAVLRAMAGADSASSRTLLLSAAAGPFSALRRLDGFEPPHLLRDVTLAVHGVGTFHARRSTDDIIHLLTAREPHVRAVLEQHLRPGGVFVDAGSNIGFYSIIAARLVGPAGKVVAIEMLPDTAHQLRSHVALNRAPHIEIAECALSDRGGEEMTIGFNPRKLGQASIMLEKGTGTARVRTARLDDILDGVGAIDLIKMDLEGAEYRALLGAGAVLARTRAIVFESNDRDPRILSLLSASGFDVKPMDGHDYLAVRRP